MALLKTKTSCILFFMLITAITVNAQKTVGYFGKRYYVGIEKSMGLLNLGKPYGNGYKPGLISNFRIEKQVRYRTILGISAGHNSYDFKYSDFTNESRFISGGVIINDNGKDIYVETGDGNIDVSVTNIQFSAKWFGARKSAGPLGTFFMLSAGVRTVKSQIQEGFRFYETWYNKNDYITVEESNPVKISLPYIGLEAGHTQSFFKIPNLLFTYSFNWNIAINPLRKYQQDASMHMAYTAAKYDMKHRNLNFNLSLSYAL